MEIINNRIKQILMHKKINSYVIFIFMTIYVIISPYAIAGANSGLRPSSSSAHASPEPVIIDENTEKIPLGLHLEILEDKEKKLTIKDVTSKEISGKFKRSNQESPSFGYTSSAYWVRFRIDSKLKNDKMMLLELDYPLMDKIELYIPASDNKYIIKKAGCIYPFPQREIRHRNFVFKISGRTGQSGMYYMRFENENRMELTLLLWSNNLFYQKDHFEQIIFGIYYGIILAILLYNIFFSFFIKDKSIIYFIIFIFLYGLFQLNQNGIIYEYTWAESLSKYYQHVLDYTLLFFSIQFFQTSLNLKSALNLFDKIFNILKFISILSGIFLIFHSFAVSVIVVVFLFMTLFINVLIAGSICIINKYNPAKYIMIACSLGLIGGLINGLKLLAIIPNNFFTTNALQFGSVFVLTLFSLGLGSSISLLRQEKLDTQEKLIESQKHEMEILTSTNREILELEGKIVKISEAERQSIGMELHDGLTQDLLGIAIKARLLAERLKTKNSGDGKRAREIEALINKSIEDARKIAHGLYPAELKEAGIPAFSDGLTRRISALGNIDLTFKIDDTIRIQDSFIFSQLYYITFEAAKNAIKHSGADSLEIMLKEETDFIILKIRDNGAGMISKKQDWGIGLDIMRYRARMIGADFNVLSERRKGTTVICILKK